MNEYIHINELAWLCSNSKNLYLQNQVEGQH